MVDQIAKEGEFGLVGLRSKSKSRTAIADGEYPAFLGAAGVEVFGFQALTVIRMAIYFCWV